MIQSGLICALVWILMQGTDRLLGSVVVLDILEFHYPGSFIHRSGICAYETD